MIAAVLPRALDTIRSVVPADVDVVPLEGPPPRETTVLVPGPTDTAVLEAIGTLPELRLVQVLSAGTDAVEAYVPEWVTLCNARGTRDAAVADWCLAALLGASTGVLHAARARTWSSPGNVELGTWRIVIVGHGSIGRELERRLGPIGPQVTGVASRARDDLRGPEALPELLPEADAVVLLSPLTPESEGMVDAGFLARMKDDALLVNAGRGLLVDTDALTAELEAGRLRAVLDVTDPEPLPEGHPLWQAKGTLAITPHHGGATQAADARAARLAGKQIARLAQGEPLENVVRAARRRAA
jgi:phosphoglycerate dehydrogenase-like enzyme